MPRAVALGGVQPQFKYTRLTTSRFRPGRKRKFAAQPQGGRRRKNRDRLENAARELLTSDGWARWIRVRASNGLGRYSLRNQWLIGPDCAARGITPPYVAGVPRLAGAQPRCPEGIEGDLHPCAHHHEGQRRRRPRRPAISARSFGRSRRSTGYLVFGQQMSPTLEAGKRLPAGILLSPPCAGVMREGTGCRLARSSRSCHPGRATARRRSRARLAGTPREQRTYAGVIAMPDEATASGRSRPAAAARPRARTRPGSVSARTWPRPNRSTHLWRP